tara:strand:+ start:793 stop:1548 length:756 start_codon:yes stop_codon:yes gene_type:complete
MHKLGISLSLFKNLAIFSSGLALGFLPSKSGELVRYYFLKKENVSLSTSVPVHFVSNITNFVVVLLCATPILFIFGKEKIFFIAVGILLLLYTSFRKPILYLKLLRFIRNKTKLNFIQNIEKTLISSKKLLDVKGLLISFTLTVFHYMAIWLILFFILRDLSDTSFFLTVSIYSLSLIAGAISMIPGGIGVIEGGNIAMLSFFMDPVIATTFILVVRFFTFWIPCFIGFIFLTIISNKKFRRPILKYEKKN